VARTPRELEGEARRVVTRRPDPDTLDADERKSGSAVSTPRQPRGDFDRSFRADARYEEQPDAVPENVPQRTGRVRPKTSGRRYEVR
jgi:hypothetical protein